MRLPNISNSEPEKFVSCRVGLELKNYEEDIAKLLKENRINGTKSSQSPIKRAIAEATSATRLNPLPPGHNATDGPGSGNFILIPITPARPEYYELSNRTNGDHFTVYDDHVPTDYTDHLLPDLVLSKHKWETEVAVSVGRIPLFARDPSKASARLEVLLRHALYLPTCVIVIDVPCAKSAHPSMAKVINKLLLENHTQRLLLFRIPLELTNGRNHTEKADLGWGLNDLVRTRGWHHPQHQQDTAKQMDIVIETTSESGYDDKSHSSLQDSQTSEASQEVARDPYLGGWACWHSLRSHLVPDHRIGVCLEIKDDLEHDFDEAAKWQGEPVRMIIMGTDRFVATKGMTSSMRPAGGIKLFLKMITSHNSLCTSFVVQPQAECNFQDHLNCLSHICDTLAGENPDVMRAWDDIPLSPLQPLSCNLDSNTYQIFELDVAKYSHYQSAILQALGSLLARPESTNRKRFYLMVLGAGRGPLVDAMISAIHKLKTRATRVFKIYALDKNRSSIVSLKWKQVHLWAQHWPLIETEVVEADMRSWAPREKADIITTELLGSFSDNELSPECIDGTWRFATDRTICLPQSYTSHLAPICSFRMRQELYKTSQTSRDELHFDRIQVVRLTNHYIISRPKPLFTYKHLRLGRPQREGANIRETTLIFHTDVDTVVHGFSGYFSSNLFGGVKISTVPEEKTATMESWFPVYIPIEKCVELPAKSELEVRFARKESAERVWYEWQLLRPEVSRVYNQNGVASSMSKMI